MDYKDNLIKQYDNWSLYLHENQYYLGRCYLWYAKDMPVDLFETDLGLIEELYDITRSLKTAISTCFNPDMYNYASLNNLTRHLHFHVVPRYQRPVTFDGMLFEDKNWGGNYSPYPHDFKVSESTMKNIKEQLYSELKKAG